MSISGLTARKVNSGSGDGDLASQCFYEYRWEPKALTASEAPPRRAGVLRLEPTFGEAMEAVCASVEAEAHWARYYREAEPLLSAAAAAHVLSAFAAPPLAWR